MDSSCHNFCFLWTTNTIMISSNEIKKDIGKLDEYTTSTKKDFLNYVKNNLTSNLTLQKSWTVFLIISQLCL